MCPLRLRYKESNEMPGYDCTEDKAYIAKCTFIDFTSVFYPGIPPHTILYKTTCCDTNAP